MTLMVGAAYLVAATLFILALRWMSSPETARRAVLSAVAAMTIAVVATLVRPDVVNYQLIAIAAVLGTIVGVPLSRVPLTAVPERTGLSQSFGGLAAALVGTAKYYLWLEEGGLTPFRTGVISLEIILGCLTCTGGLMAAGKLADWIPSRSITYPFQNIVNLSLLGAALLLGVYLVINPAASWAVPVIIVLSLAFGIALLMPIGGADMPTVISFLNAYAGISAVLMGIILENLLLITAGALDGASGFILSVVMCKAMNRPMTNVLFGAFGSAPTAGAAGGEVKVAQSATAGDAAMMMSQADRVVIVPGYGMAVAQAQHRARELYDQLTKRGVDVKFAVHPVAGRMPGHMNVLLAEADIPYDHLVEMEDINPDMPQVDVVLVIGANDVVNPAARSDTSSPIYGMPIIDADKARTVLCIKRSMNPGFSGIENELYFAPNTLMLFGDAKVMMGDIVKHLTGEAQAA
ncbi:MAG TPA: NAD(P)(+) transhydrogenase (Re/Si-specific) subunit beta [Vicinamibacterales bacterium]|nr:NAD(P)(+) transhydrogenase (Re/Si-specific) subunit beta [Vicinamibacterales bacterium]